jgi:guanidinoacetate N-methyltransferase
MTRRIRRVEDFEVALQITRDDFLRPPRESQRNWLLNRALNELVLDLQHLDRLAAGFVAGRDRPELADRTQAVLRDEDIMEDWQIPVMRAMARIATEAHGDVLEVGFGRGISATMIQEAGVRSHTVVECNDSVVARYRPWRDSHPDRDIRLIHGRWQESVEQLERYDAIFFHTYPLDQEEYVESVVRSVTFAESFFPVAAGHLREGGAFTYFTNEADSLSRAHQRLVLRHFRSFALEQVSPLDIPEDSRDDLWGDSLLVIRAVR